VSKFGAQPNTTTNNLLNSPLSNTTRVSRHHKPGTERVQALTGISRSALCCHSNETRAPTGNPPNSAQLEGRPGNGDGLFWFRRFINLSLTSLLTSCLQCFGRQEGHPTCKTWGMTEVGISPDGVAPSRMVGVSASVNFPLHYKVQKFSSGTGSPGWPRKKGHKTVVVWWWWLLTYFYTYPQYLATAPGPTRCIQSELRVVTSYSSRHNGRFAAIF